MDLLAELNDSQRAAVAYNEGPQLVIAGAGSGKTRVLTYKIAYLLQQGVPAYNILALTFTNKAAREMKERINKLVGEQTARYLWMGTFHSIFSRILRQEIQALGQGFTTDYSIYDTADTKSLIKSILKEMGLDEKVYKPGVVMSRISMAKNYLMTPYDYAHNADWQAEDRVNRLYRMVDIFYSYNNRLRSANAMDFDDLLFNMHTLLQQNEQVRQKYQQIFRHVLVDEYQDTNYVQYKIVSMLAAPDNRVCVVGDDAQSIYSFRGATIDNILHFQEQYASSRLFKLERNYRSTQNIVNAANSLIRKNTEQIPKEVYSEKETGERIQISAHDTDKAEAQFISGQISLQHRLEQIPYNNFAILYRTNAQSRSLEDELRKLSIPYRIYGSVSFYQRKEVKDAISYFRLVVNPSDDEAFKRVINFPARGIGATTLGKLQEYAHEQNIPLFEIVKSIDQHPVALSSATQNKLLRFAGMITDFRQQAEKMNAYELARYILNSSSVMQAAMADKTNEGIERKENLEELLSGINEFVEEQMRNGNTWIPINDFLAEVSLLTDQDERLNDDQPHVTLMTVHAAKGLEFNVVFIAGLEEHLFPSPFAMTNQEMEEERRLLYVAITRAEEKCYITYARSRFRNGQVNFSPASRFLKDLDTRYIMRTDEISSAPHRWYSSDNEYDNSFPRPAERPAIPFTQPKTQNLRKTTGMQPKGDRLGIDCPYPVGARVRHAVFGEGTVTDAYSENGNDKLEVNFDKSGKRTLMLKFAKLDLVSK